MWVEHRNRVCITGSLDLSISFFHSRHYKPNGLVLDRGDNA
jgi:hypothetical protein